MFLSFLVLVAVLGRRAPEHQLGHDKLGAAHLLGRVPLLAVTHLPAALDRLRDARAVAAAPLPLRGRAVGRGRRDRRDARRERRPRGDVLVRGLGRRHERRRHRRPPRTARFRTRPRRPPRGSARRPPRRHAHWPTSAAARPRACVAPSQLER